MSRPRLRPAFAACSCSWKPSLPVAAPSQNAYATLSASSATPSEPLLDFLYPAFGFFSRSLPPPCARPPRPPPNTPIPPSHVDHDLSSTSAPRPPAGTWRRGFEPVAKCVCGRPKQSCLRCRSVSTSAAPRRLPDELPNASEEDDELPPPVEESPQDELATTPPSPPPPLAPPISTSSSATRDSMSKPEDDTEVLSPLEPLPPLTDSERAAVIQQVRIDLGFRPRSYVKGSRSLAPSIGSRRSGSRPLAPLQALEEEIDSRWQLGRRLMEMRGEGLSVKERGDFIQRLGRLARASRRVAEDPLEEAGQALRWSQLRRRTGWYMEQMLSSMSVTEEGSHGRHEPALWIDARALQDRLGPIDYSPPSSLPTIEVDPYLHRLYVLFLQPTTSPEAARRVETIRRSTLSLLLESWLRGKDGAEHAINFVCGWQQQDVLQSTGTKKEAGFQLLLRRRYGEVLARLQPSPSAWLSASTHDSFDYRQIGPHLVNSLATAGSPLEAVRVWQALKRQLRTPLPSAVELKTMATLLEGLAQGKYYQDASRLAKDLDRLATSFLPSSSSSSPGDSPPLVSSDIRAHLIHAYRMMARVAAEQGQQSQLETTISQLQRTGGSDAVEVASRQMRLASRWSKIKEVRRIFDTAVAKPMSKEARARLTGVLVAAYVRMDDLETATAELTKLLEAGIKPSVHLVNSLLHGHAARNDVDATYSLFRRLACGELGSLPNSDSYNALVTAHCNLRDVDSAEEVVIAMKQAGVTPNQRVWTTLMNTYVELGDWMRTIKVYSLLEKSNDTLLRPDTASVNVALKAAILTATPVSTVLALFRQALDRGCRPSATSYTTVMQSVCAAGLMDVAEDLFALIDASADSGALPVSMKHTRPDVFLFSTLISGYLNAGELVKARACLGEMRRRGIEPTSITYGIIVGSFLEERTVRGAQKASEFALRFLSNSPLDAVRRHQSARLDRHLARGDELLSVFAPILKHHAKRGEAEVALATFQLILDNGARPSIELYTTLMDAYRRGDDPEEAARNVSTVWRGLHQSVLDAYARRANSYSTGPLSTRWLDAIASPSVANSSLPSPSAAQTSPPSTPSLTISSSHSHDLRLPLNILIDSLDRAGLREAIHETWTNLAREGFSFDAANWNALARHLVKDHQLERACWIIHNILMDPTIAEGRTQDSVVDEDTTADRKLLNSRFATIGSPMMAAPTRTPSRLADQRHMERHAHRKAPIRIEELINSPVAAQGGDVGERGFLETVGSAQAVRRRVYWFAHASLLSELEQALEVLMAGGGRRMGDETETKVVEKEEASKFVAELQEEYPRAFEALRGWKGRDEEASTLH
ncbi:hypothetical protein BCR35DRAFT_351708 [Leucosporidium creatinivorum]|uniref:PROP1-like PPR domain-containing protein n=1 Tax=Leucosporidium creatinivorum TaxID=106004 RepID=A0A1Y2FN54_9BASI|nr:hypothetical protein BCR35DRAFT_351708 [Leucosporidium creatinivorum]